MQNTEQQDGQVLGQDGAPFQSSSPSQNASPNSHQGVGREDFQRILKENEDLKIKHGMMGGMLQKHKEYIAKQKSNDLKMVDEALKSFKPNKEIPDDKYLEDFGDIRNLFGDIDKAHTAEVLTKMASELLTYRQKETMSKKQQDEQQKAAAASQKAHQPRSANIADQYETNPAQKRSRTEDYSSSSSSNFFNQMATPREVQGVAASARYSDNDQQESPSDRQRRLAAELMNELNSTPIMSIKTTTGGSRKGY
jgi:ribosomal protein S7